MSDAIEVRPGFAAGPAARDAVFDWDGTLSYIRAGWGEVMMGIFLAHLPPLPGEGEAARRRVSHDDIWSLNGKPTIHQMQRLADRVAERGGKPLAPAAYQALYAEALGRVCEARLDDVRSGRRGADEYMPPGARAFLEALRGRGVRLHVASGTEQRFVQAEAEALGVAPLFEGRIHGPASPADQAYSKRGVMDAIIARERIAPRALAVFGDGHVEIEQAHALGAVAVAVATDEEVFSSGHIDAAKRARLNGVGADAVIPDYRNAGGILPLLGLA